MAPLVVMLAAWLLARVVGASGADICAARAGLLIVGRRAPGLSVRLPLQLFWIGALWWTATEGS